MSDLRCVGHLHLPHSWSQCRCSEWSTDQDLQYQHISRSYSQIFPGGLVGKESNCNAGDLGSTPGLGISPGGGNSYSLQYYVLENSMDYSPWGRKEFDMTEQMSLSLSNAESLILPCCCSAAKSLQLCPTLRPHRRQPTRLPCPWHSQGKNTGVGCHFLLQCVKVKSLSRVQLIAIR